MKFEIKHRITGSVLFSLETENLKLCVEAAVKANADLRGADLGGAYLRDAYLRDAYLRGADLGGANLRGADLGGGNLRDAYLRGADLGGAKIHDSITVTKPPLQITGLAWAVVIWDVHMQIGCEFHTHDAWRRFSDEEWLRMGGKVALKMKREQFHALIVLCDQHRPNNSYTESED